MRGFSIFAPVLGSVLVVVAVITAASIHQGEVYRANQLASMQAKIYLSSLPDYVKWDDISYVITFLRPWFYEHFNYVASTRFGEGEKKKLADVIVTAIGDESDNRSWIVAGPIEFRTYLKGEGPGTDDLAEAMDVVTEDEKIVISVEDERDKIPTLVVEVRDRANPSAVETIEMKLFEGKVTIPVFYPAKKVIETTENVTEAAKNVYLISGFLDEDAPAVEVGDDSGKIAQADLPIDTGTVIDPFHPARSRYNPFAGDTDEARAYGDGHYVMEALREWIRKIDPDVEVTGVESTEKEGRDGIPYIRLICIRGDLARVLSNEKADVVCVEAEEEIGDGYEVKGGKAKYARVTSATVDLQITAESTCAPGGKVRANVTVDLTFGKDKTITANAEISNGQVVIPNESGDNPEPPKIEWCTGSGMCCTEGVDGCVCVDLDGDGKKDTCYTIEEGSNGACADDYICGCGSPDWESCEVSGTGGTEYLETSTDAESSCAERCSNWSKGFLTVDECKNICKPYYWSYNTGCYAGIDEPKSPEVCYRASKKEIIEEVVEKLKHSYVDACKDTVEEGLCKKMMQTFLSRWGENKVFSGEPTIKGGPAVLSITYFEFEPDGGKIKITNDGVEGKACIAKDSGC